jgi:predicted component of viral defense system (DUF524 family)
MHTALNGFKEKMLKHLRTFYIDLHRELIKVLLSADSLSRVAVQLISTAANRVSNITGC